MKTENSAPDFAAWAELWRSVKLRALSPEQLIQLADLVASILEDLGRELPKRKWAGRLALQIAADVVRDLPGNIIGARRG